MKIALLFFIATGSLFAGDVTDAFRALVSRASAARVVAVLPEGRRVTELSHADIEAFAEAFDFIDPTPQVLPDGRKIHSGPCRCLPTHSVTFVIPGADELVLFVNLEAAPTVDVDEKEVERLHMPWHTSLGLSPSSAQAVTKLLSSK